MNVVTNKKISNLWTPSSLGKFFIDSINTGESLSRQINTEQMF